MIDIHTINYHGYRSKTHIRVFSIERMKNFYIYDFKVLDNYTTLSVVNIVYLITFPFSIRRSR